MLKKDLSSTSFDNIRKGIVLLAGVLVGCIGLVITSQSSIGVSALVLLSVGLALLISISVARRSWLAFFDFASAFPLAVAFYSFSYPMSLIFQGKTSEISYFALLLVVLGEFSCIIGSAVAAHGWYRTGCGSLDARPQSRFFYVGLLLSGLGVASYLTLFMTAGGGSSYFEMAYSERYLLERGLGFITLWRGLTIPGICLIVYSASGSDTKRSRLIFAVAIVAVVAVFEVLSGKRRLLLSLIIGFLCSYHVFIRRLDWKKAVLLSPIAWISVSSFGYIRGLLSGRFIDLASRVEDIRSAFSWAWLDPGRMEFGYAFRLLSDIVAYIPSLYGYWMGRSYVEIPIQQIPSILIGSTRPLSPTEWVASTIYPDLFARGGGYGFFVTAEGYVNFGVLGVVAHMFLLGYFGVRLQRLLFRTSLGSIVYCVMIPSMLSLVRGCLSGFVKESIIGRVLPVVVSWVLLDGMSRIIKNKHQRFKVADYRE